MTQQQNRFEFSLTRFANNRESCICMAFKMGSSTFSHSSFKRRSSYLKVQRTSNTLKWYHWRYPFKVGIAVCSTILITWKCLEERFSTLRVLPKSKNIEKRNKSDYFDIFDSRLIKYVSTGWRLWKANNQKKTVHTFSMSRPFVLSSIFDYRCHPPSPSSWTLCRWLSLVAQTDIALIWRTWKCSAHPISPWNPLREWSSPRNIIDRIPLQLIIFLIPIINLTDWPRVQSLSKP